MLESKLELGKVNAQIEIHTDGLYIAVYLNTGDSIKDICKLSLDDLVLDYVKTSSHNNLISEKYVQAGIYLASGEKEKSFQIFEEIIISKNNFYSVLALNTILEKELTKNKEKILGFFEIIEQLDIDQNRKDLILFKKALYLLKSSDFETGNKLLKKLIESNSKLKIYAEEVLDN